MSNHSEYDWSLFRPKEHAVLTFLRDGESVLLIHKLRGLGAGKINAPGGRIEQGERPEEAARRETLEEVGLTVGALERMAALDFAFTDGYTLCVDVFLSSDYSGSAISTDEAVPFWVNEQEIPYDKMWDDDRYWLPRVLAGEMVHLQGHFDGETMLSHRIERL